MNTVEICVSPSCGFCHAAKRLLSQKGAEISEIDVSRDPDRRREMIQRANGRLTVPQVFVGPDHDGRCDDLYALERSGRLNDLIAA